MQVKKIQEACKFQVSDRVDERGVRDKYGNYVKVFFYTEYDLGTSKFKNKSEPFLVSRHVANELIHDLRLFVVQKP